MIAPYVCEASKIQYLLQLDNKYYVLKLFIDKFTKLTRIAQFVEVAVCLL